jgi:hypothetical protein
MSKSTGVGENEIQVVGNRQMRGAVIVGLNTGSNITLVVILSDAPDAGYRQSHVIAR